MKILGVDFETTGLDRERDQIIEVGAVLWDVEASQPVKILSEMIKPEGVTELSPEVESITGLKMSMLERYGTSYREVWTRALGEMAKCADVFMAHNAPFDRAFYERAIRDNGLDPGEKKIWINSETDLPNRAYEKGRSRSLSYLAADHGFLNPFPHRAVTDVLTMFKVFEPYSNEMDLIIEQAMSPRLLVIAQVSFEDKDLAKNAGFKWNANRKTWEMLKRECDMWEGSPFEFPIKVIEQGGPND